MDDLNVIDQFTQTFITYIDSGFGLLAGDVAFLTSILVAIDITLAGLWWAMDEGSNVLARLIRKVLYVGAFALILNNWQIRSEEPTSELQSLMRISYAVFCLKKKHHLLTKQQHKYVMKTTY